MSVAYAIATRSKDESTNFGSVIVDKDNTIVATGYNSFPSGLDDDKPERQKRPEKYLFFEHAERNAIFSCSRRGSSSRGCKIYIQSLPCAKCARAIIQAGITDVIVHKQWVELSKKTGDFRNSWSADDIATLEMFREAKVTLHYFDAMLAAVPVVPLYMRGKRLVFSDEGDLIYAE